MKIKGPSINSSTCVIVDDGGLWDIRISVTLPATHARIEIYPTVIGLRASVGGWNLDRLYKAYHRTWTVNCCSDSDRVTGIKPHCDAG